MPRALSGTLLIAPAVALLLAAASGCASPALSGARSAPAGDGAAPMGAPRIDAPRADAPARADAAPGADAAPRAAAQPTATAAAPVAPAAAAEPARRVAGSGARAASQGRAAPPAAREPRPAGSARAGGGASGSAAADAAGPTVTTFVYSDAPAPVRREPAADEARRAAGGRVPEGFNPYGIRFAPGAYRCELGRSVRVRAVSSDLRTAVLGWGGAEHTLRAVDAPSGALRYEDPASGLAWIVLRDRAMLLDTRAGQRLANACRA